MNKNTLLKLRTNGLPNAPVCNVAAREPDRQRIAADVQQFINRGGRIQHVDHTANQAQPTITFNNKRLQRPDANNFLFGARNA